MTAPDSPVTERLHRAMAEVHECQPWRECSICAPYIAVLSPVVEALVAEAKVEVLREAAMTPAAMRVNTDGNASGREWMNGLADRIEKEHGDE